MRILPPYLLPKAVFNEGERPVPKVAPGAYSVKVRAGDQERMATLSVVSNPGLNVSEADLQAQFALLSDLRARLDENHRTVHRIRDLRDQVKAWRTRARTPGTGDPLKATAEPLVEQLTALERRLTNPDIKADEDDLVYPPQLDHDWTWLTGVVASAEARPTAGAMAIHAQLKAQQAQVLKDLATLEAEGMTAFQKAVDTLGLPRILPSAPPE
jgi:hypothetical protein